VAGCDTDDGADGTFSSSCSHTSSLMDSDQTFADSTSNWDEDDDTRLRPDASQHRHQPSSEWSAGSDDQTPLSPRSPSFPLPDSSQSSTADSEVPPGQRLFNVFDLPSALDVLSHQPASLRKHPRHSRKTSG